MKIDKIGKLVHGADYNADQWLDRPEILQEDIRQVLAAYESDFYAGMPAVTRKRYGEGAAYYMAARAEGDFLYAFYRKLIQEKGIQRIVQDEYVPDVMVKERGSGDKKSVFLMNFSSEERKIGTKLLKGYEVKIIS